jgi:FkbM family methyltransferase
MKLLPNVSIIEARNGLKWLSFERMGYIANQLATTGSYQPEIIEACIKEIGDGTKDVLDIGANMGSFCVPVARSIKGTVYAFECQTTMFKLLTTNLLVNRVDNAVPIHGAVLDQYIEPFSDIPVQDYENGRDIGGFSLDPENNTMKTHITLVSGAVDRVRNVTIDEFGFKNVGFVKIDVEGLEYKVIKGMEKTLKDNGYPPILFECGEGPENTAEREKLHAYVESMGYKIEHVILDNYLAKFK